MTNKSFPLMILTAMLSLTAVPAGAGILTYSTLGGWQAAGPQAGTITFEGVSIPANFTSFTISPLTFSASNGHTLAIANNFGPGTGNFLLNPSPTNIAGDNTVFGLGFDFRCYSCDGLTATITVTDASGSTPFSVATTSVGISNFFAVRSTLSIQNLQISFGGANPYVALDNVAFGGAAPADTPEAATMILIGTGLALIARYRKYSPQLTATA